MGCKGGGGHRVPSWDTFSPAEKGWYLRGHGIRVLSFFFAESRISDIASEESKWCHSVTYHWANLYIQDGIQDESRLMVKTVFDWHVTFYRCFIGYFYVRPIDVELLDFVLQDIYLSLSLIGYWYPQWHPRWQPNIKTSSPKGNDRSPNSKSSNILNIL